MAKVRFISAVLSLFFASSLSMAQDAEISRVNINTSPIGFILGAYNVGVDVAITPNISIGVNGLFASYDSDNVDIDATGIGLRSIFFFNQVFQDSWYASVDVGTLSVDGEDGTETASVNGFTTAAKLGYFWRWSNFNIQLGLGIQNLSLDIDSSTTTDIKNDLEDLDGVAPAIDFMIGYAF